MSPRTVMGALVVLAVTTVTSGSVAAGIVGGLIVLLVSWGVDLRREG